MKEYTVLTINPGSTGTKLGLMKGKEIVLDLNVDVLPGEFDSCQTIPDQIPIREKKIYETLEANHVNLNEIDAVAGRGVGVVAVEGGTYLINETAYNDAKNDKAGIRHVATLGIVMAKDIADKIGVNAYFVNPMSTDELCDEARMTGIRGLYRPSHAHPLNMKQVAIMHSELQGKKYEDCNYVILHLGGGISIGAHKKGRAVDQTRIGDGQGPISPNRSGDLCVDDVIQLMKKGYPIEKIVTLCNRRGGLIELTGTDDLRKIKTELIPSGDKRAEMACRAMEYTIVKWTAAMAGALKGDVDAILVTGGMAHDEELIAEIKKDTEWIAPVYVYPGSFETEALAFGVMRVLSGQEKEKVYTGEPSWKGFDF